VLHRVNTKIAVRDGHHNQNLCLTLTLVIVRNNVNKNFKDVSKLFGRNVFKVFINIVSNVNKSQCQAQILILITLTKYNVYC